MTVDPTGTEAFLARAASELAVGGWIFTGFNWPVLAARTARRAGTPFVQVLEAGAALHTDTAELITSTTDYFVTDAATCWRGSLVDVVAGIVPRCSRVLIDAANVDLRGRTNSSAIGDWRTPKVRLPGGGGGPDVATNAHNLVLLHGGTQVERIVAAVEPVTAAPGPSTVTTLVTRWGRLHLGKEPRLLSVVDGPGVASFVGHLESLGVDVTDQEVEEMPSEAAIADAGAVLAEALDRGYSVTTLPQRSPAP